MKINKQKLNKHINRQNKNKEQINKYMNKQNTEEKRRATKRNNYKLNNNNKTWPKPEVPVFAKRY